MAKVRQADFRKALYALNTAQEYNRASVFRAHSLTFDERGALWLGATNLVDTFAEIRLAEPDKVEKDPPGSNSFRTQELVHRVLGIGSAWNDEVEIERRRSGEWVVKARNDGLPIECLSATPIDSMRLQNVDGWVNEGIVDLIAGVAHAMSGDETRRHLCAVLLDQEDDEIRVTATDGHRLARRRTRTESPIGSVLIPEAAVHALVRMRKFLEGLQVFSMGQTCSIRTQSAGVAFRPRPGTYPSVEGVFSVPRKTSVTFHDGRPIGDELARFKDAVVTIRAGNGEITVDSDGGLSPHPDAENEDESEPNVLRTIPAKVEGDCSQSIRVNAAYLREALKSIPGQCTIAWSERLNPIVISRTASLTPMTIEGDWLEVIMPCR